MKIIKALFALFLAYVFTSCESPFSGSLNLAEEEKVTAIASSKESATTKAAPLTAVPNTFSAWGYAWKTSGGSQSTPSWMCGETFTKNGSVWESANYHGRIPEGYSSRLWAIAPSGASGLSSTPGASTSGAPSFNYTVPSAITSQSDICVAYGSVHTSTPNSYPLAFEHVLAGACFRSSATASFPCTVVSVSLSGVKNNGHYTQGSGWSSLSGNATYSFSPNTVIAAADRDVLIGTTANTMMLIPQTLASGATLSIVINRGSGNETVNMDVSGVELQQGCMTIFRLGNGAEGEPIIEIILESLTLTNLLTGDSTILMNGYIDGTTSGSGNTSQTSLWIEAPALLQLTANFSDGSSLDITNNESVTWITYPVSHNITTGNIPNQSTTTYSLSARNNTALTTPATQIVGSGGTGLACTKTVWGEMVLNSPTIAKVRSGTGLTSSQLTQEMWDGSKKYFWAGIPDAENPGVRVTWNYRSGGIINRSNVSTLYNYAPDMGVLVSASFTYNGVTRTASATGITTADAMEYEYRLTVSPSSASIFKTGTRQLSAVLQRRGRSTYGGTPGAWSDWSDYQNLNNASWSNGGSSYATVSSSGLVTGTNTSGSNQTVTITASWSGTVNETAVNVSGTATITVRGTAPLFGGVEIADGNLYYNGTSYVISNDWSAGSGSYNSIYGKNSGSYYHSYVEMGALFENSGFTTSDGDIENNLNPLSGWRLPTEDELRKFIDYNPSSHRTAATVNGSSKYYQEIVVSGISFGGYSSPSGVLLFPDGETINGASLSGYEPTITLSELNEYLGQGCVFLLDTGQKADIGGWGGGGYYAYYMSSSESYTSYSCTGLSTVSSSVSISNQIGKDDKWNPVRLVRTPGASPEPGPDPGAVTTEYDYQLVVTPASATIDYNGTQQLTATMQRRSRTVTGGVPSAWSEWSNYQTINDNLTWMTSSVYASADVYGLVTGSNLSGTSQDVIVTAYWFGTIDETHFSTISATATITVNAAPTLFAGLQLASGPLYYDGSGFAIASDWTTCSYNSSNGLTSGSTFFTFTQMGALFEKSGFANSDGNIDNNLDPLDGWRMPTSTEWSNIITTSSSTRAGSTVNGSANKHFAHIRLTGVTYAGSTTPRGLLVFPDGKTISGKTLSGMDNTTSTTNVSVSELNTYLSQGCIFLPAGGYYQASWSQGGTQTHIWSSTQSSNANGIYLNITATAHATANKQKSLYSMVWLVK